MYGLRVAKSNHGFVSLGANTESVTRAQHCRAEFWSQAHGWVPVDPADVRKVALEEPPGNLPLDHPKVKEARERLFGYWEMNWLAYNRGHDLQLPGASGFKVPYFMYPDGANGARTARSARSRQVPVHDRREGTEVSGLRTRRPGRAERCCGLTAPGFRMRGQCTCGMTTEHSVIPAAEPGSRRLRVRRGCAHAQ